MIIEDLLDERAIAGRPANLVISGVLPQQPPRSRTPSLSRRLAKSPKYSGLAM